MLGNYATYKRTIEANKQAKMEDSKLPATTPTDSILAELSSVKNSLNKEVASIPPKVAPTNSTTIPVQQAQETVNNIQLKEKSPAFNNLMGYIGEKIKSKGFQNAVADLGQSLMIKAGQPSGQMINGHFVANNTIGLENLPNITQQRKQNELAQQQIVEQRENRKADIAYRNALLDDKRAEKAEQKKLGQEKKVLTDKSTLDTVKSISRAVNYTNHAGENYQGINIIDNISGWFGSLFGTGKGQYNKNFEDLVDQVVAPQMKEILGAQFAEKEGARLMATLKNKNSTLEERNQALLNLTNKILAKQGLGRVNSVKELMSLDNPFGKVDEFEDVL